MNPRIHYCRLAAAVAALVWANSPWSARYFEILGTYIGISWGGVAFKLTLHHWINDGLMAVFFFVVGLEIKREFTVGHLASHLAIELGQAALGVPLQVANNAHGVGDVAVQLLLASFDLDLRAPVKMAVALGVEHLAIDDGGKSEALRGLDEGKALAVHRLF